MEVSVAFLKPVSIFTELKTVWIHIKSADLDLHCSQNCHDISRLSMVFRVKALKKFNCGSFMFIQSSPKRKDIQSYLIKKNWLKSCLFSLILLQPAKFL